MKFFYVYILQSEMAEETFYVGFTEDLQPRLKTHNSGQVPHPSQHANGIPQPQRGTTHQPRATPWELVHPTNHQP